jgi:hypothetical protein
MYTSVDFRNQINEWKGPLTHKQGNLIHQFDVRFGHNLKIKLLLLL